MARRERIELVDDLDGSLAGETVTFELDRQRYEIDLSRANAEALRTLLAPYIEAGRRTGNREKGTGRRVGPDPAAVRAWARANNIDLPARGRIPGTVLDQFRAAGYH